jgi:hypothetical protein
MSTRIAGESFAASAGALIDEAKLKLRETTKVIAPINAVARRIRYLRND